MKSALSITRNTTLLETKRASIIQVRIYLPSLFTPRIAANAGACELGPDVTFEYNEEEQDYDKIVDVGTFVWSCCYGEEDADGCDAKGHTPV